MAAVWYAVLGPSTLGGPTTLVQVTGESMEPGMHTGDLAVVRTADNYGDGDGSIPQPMPQPVRERT